MSKYSNKLHNEEIYKLNRELLLENVKVCEECGSKINLSVHHKKFKAKFSELNSDIENLQVLCLLCHKKKHNKIKNK